MLDKYKEQLDFKSKNYEEIEAYVENKPLVISIKIDGVLNAAKYLDGKTYLATREGRITEELPVTEEISKLLNGKQETILFGELYGVDADGKELPLNETVSITRKPKSPEDENRIKFGIFDIYKYDGKLVEENDYWKRLLLVQELFENGKYVHPVYAKNEDGSSAIKKMWEEEVLREGHEGVVLHIEGDTIKIKPTKTVDCLVIAVKPNLEKGFASSLFLALMDKDGIFRSTSFVGTGLKEEERVDWLNYANENKALAPNHDELIWLDLNKNPRIVEVDYERPIVKNTESFEFTTGEWKQLEEERLSATLIKPRFIRLREDKKVTENDLRLTQISDLEKELVKKSFKITAISGAEDYEIYYKEKHNTLPNWHYNYIDRFVEDKPLAVYLDVISDKETPTTRSILFDYLLSNLDKFKNRITNVDELLSDIELVKNYGVSKVFRVYPRGNVIPNKEIKSFKLQAYYPKHPNTIIFPKSEFVRYPLSEASVWSYYDKVKDKIIQQTRGKNVLLYLRVNGDILKRKHDGIVRIDNYNDFNRLNSGRLVEIHVESCQEKRDTCLTDVIFCDVDPKENFPWKETKEITKKIYNIFNKDSNVRSVKIHFSGNRGFHVIAKLKESWEVDRAREYTKRLLKSLESDKIKLGIVRELDMLRLDTTLLKRRGSLRAAYSLNKTTGLVAVPVDINVLDSFEKKDATIKKVLEKLNMSKKSFKINANIFQPGDLVTFKVLDSMNAGVVTGREKVKGDGRTFIQVHFGFYNANDTKLNEKINKLKSLGRIHFETTYFAENQLVKVDTVPDEVKDLLEYTFSKDFELIEHSKKAFKVVSETEKEKAILAFYYNIYDLTKYSPNNDIPWDLVNKLLVKYGITKNDVSDVIKEGFGAFAQIDQKLFDILDLEKSPTEKYTTIVEEGITDEELAKFKETVLSYKDLVLSRLPKNIYDIVKNTKVYVLFDKDRSPAFVNRTGDIIINIYHMLYYPNIFEAVVIESLAHEYWHIFSHSIGFNFGKAVVNYADGLLLSIDDIDEVLKHLSFLDDISDKNITKFIHDNFISVWGADYIDKRNKTYLSSIIVEGIDRAAISPSVIEEIFSDALAAIVQGKGTIRLPSNRFINFIFEKFSKKAFKINSDNPYSGVVSGIWAIWQDDVEAATAHGLYHESWFPTIGFPDKGTILGRSLYDKVTRGRFMIVNGAMQVRIYKNAGNPEEALDKSDRLLNKIGHKGEYNSVQFWIEDDRSSRRVATKFIVSKKASILDYPKPGLEPKVWQYDGTIQPQVKEQILNKLTKFIESQGHTLQSIINKIYIVGSLTSYQYNKYTDLDIHSFINLQNMLGMFKGSEEDLTELIDKNWRKTLNKAEAETIEGTQHPLEFYFEIPEDLDVAPSDGVYDLLNDKWIKEPRTIDIDFDVEKIYPEIINNAKNLAKELDINFGELKRNVTDAEMLQEMIDSLSEEQKELFKSKLTDKVEEIDEVISKLIKVEQGISDQRHEDYAWDSPGNIHFKYLQRFGYVNMLKLLEKAVGADKKFDVDDIDTTQKVLNPIKSFKVTARFYDTNSPILLNPEGKGEGRHRLIDPQSFDKDSFRRWSEWAGVKAPEGITFLVGDLLKEKKKALQAIRFDTTKITEKEASKFWDKVKNKKGFEKTWKW